MYKSYIYTIFFSFVFVLLLSAETNVLWSLERCVEYGLEHSPGIQKDELEPLRQRLVTSTLRNKYAFMLDVGTDYNSVKEKSGGNVSLKKAFPGEINVSTSASADDGGSDGDNSQSYTLRLTKKVLGGGSFRASNLAIDNSLLDQVASLNRLSFARRRLSNQITTLYYQVIRDIQTLKVRQMQQQRGERNHEHAVERDNPLDIINAELDVKENKVSVLRAERAIESSLDKLKEIMGVPIDSELLLISEVRYTPEDIDVAADLATCLVEHEDILNQQLSIAKVENEMWARRREVLPSVNISGSLNQNHDDSEGSGEIEHSLGIDLAWEIGSGTSRNRVRTMTYRIREEKLSLMILKREKQRSIRDLARRLDEQQRQVELSEERIVVQEKRLELYRDRWENGEIDILEYIRSQNDLENSRVTLVTQSTTYMGLLSDYRFATVTDKWKLIGEE